MRKARKFHQRYCLHAALLYDTVKINERHFLPKICARAAASPKAVLGMPCVRKEGVRKNFYARFAIDKGGYFMKFYICKHCHNIIAYVHDSGVPVVCCGEKMTEIIPNTTDAATEKHVPVVKVEGQKVTVTVGSVDHPMLPEHYITWIALHTKQGNQRKELAPGAKPCAEFMLCEGDEVIAAYEYCNLHGLWKSGSGE